VVLLTRMPPKHHVRDPDKISTNDPFSEAILAQEGIWEPAQLIEMDAAFVAAMTRVGYEITAPSSRPGTQRPIAGYYRTDT
jgi:hypothetical protein